MSFYRKYRPQNFANLVGQDHVQKTLLNSIKNGHVSHAYIFCGPRGTGKTTTARLLAKVLNCLDLKKNGEPCEKCSMCKDTMSGRLIDLIEIDAASNRGIDEIRDLREKIKFTPSHAKKKVYIIDEVHMLTKEAFNALLKTLEEPPAHAHFVLATTQAYKVPETIISRCQRFDFKRIDEENTVKRLEYIAKNEKISAEKEAFLLIAKNANGGLRDAIGLLEQMSSNGKLTYEHVKAHLGVAGSKFAADFLRILQKGEMKEALSEINVLYKNGYDLSQFTREFLGYLREKMLEAIQENDAEFLRFLLKIISEFQIAADSLKSAAIPQLPLEMAVINVAGMNKVETRQRLVSTPDLSEKPKDKQPKKISRKTESGLKSPPSEDEFLPLTQDEVTKNWQRIIERIKTPFVRRSFEQGRLEKVNNRSVSIIFSSQFHLEKIKETKNREEINASFEDLFGAPVSLSFKMGEIELEPEIDEDEVVIEDLIEEKDKEADDLAKKTADLFGGEVME